MKRSPLTTLRNFAQRHPLAARRALRGAWFAAAAFLLQVPQAARSQTAYTWTSPSTGGAWTTNTNWTPNGVPGGNAGDTATLTDASANRTITLNANETIAGLTYVETQGFLNELEIDSTAGTTITLTNTGTLALGGSGVTGTELLYLNGTSATNKSIAAYNGAINVGANGQLELGSYSNVSYGLVTGALTINSSGNLFVDQSVSTSAGTPTITGAFTLNSGGTVTINHANNAVVTATVSGVDTRFTVSGNLVVGGTIANASTSVLAANTATPAKPQAELYIGGSASSAQFNSTATLTNLGTTGSAGVIYVGTNLGTSATNPGFTLTSDAQLPGVSISSGVVAGSTAYITIGSATAGGTLNVAGLYYNVVAGATEEITLSSNLTINGTNTGTTTLTADTNDPFHNNNSVAGNIILNVNGKTIDTTANARGFTTFGIYNYQLIGGGTIRSTFFNLSSTGTAGSTVTGNTVFQATGGNSTANNFGVTSGTATVGTIDPASTFYYTGTAVAATPATLLSGRTIGNVTVGTGTSASNLQVATSGITASPGLTVAGNVTVNANASLQLGGQILTFTSGANLMGNGTVAGTTANVASTGNAMTFASGATGGIVPGTVGAVGALTLTGTQTLTLASTSTSAFDIASATSFDKLNITGSNVAVAYNGTLTLNFLAGYAPTSGSFQIAGADASATGNFTNITSNVVGDTFSFDPASGVLSITAVPEPATVVQAGMMLALVGVAGARRMAKRRRQSAC